MDHVDFSNDGGCIGREKDAFEVVDEEFVAAVGTKRRARDGGQIACCANVFEDGLFDSLEVLYR
jgi:hypothetical protein